METASRKIELDFTFYGYVKESDEDSTYNEAVGILDLESGNIVVGNIELDENNNLLSKITEEEIRLRGKPYTVNRSADNIRSISKDDLKTINEALGFKDGYNFIISATYEPFDLLRYEKDTFYTSVESELNANLESGQIDIKDMDLAFETSLDGNSVYIRADLLDFTIKKD